MAKKQWDGYKDVTKLNQDELDELKCSYFDTNMPNEFSNEELFEVSGSTKYCYEDFMCNIN